MCDLKAEISETIKEKTLKALKDNNMEAMYVETKEQALRKIKSYLLEGDTIASDSSEILKQIGIVDYLSEHPREYNYLFRKKSADDLFSQQEKTELQRKVLFSDIFLCGTNAITQNGEIISIDDNSYKVAALSSGPKSIIIIAGYNQIVKDANSAIEKAKCTPVDARRLRVNCTYVLQSYQIYKNRIKIIIVGDKIEY